MYILQLNRKEIIMKNSKTTIKELTARYSAILRKCAFLNAVILMSAMVALPVNAEVVSTRTVIKNGDSKSYSGLEASNIDSSATEGGVFSMYDGNLTISDSNFSGNTAGISGVIDVRDGILTVDNSTFARNKATTSSGVIETFTRNNTLKISNSTFSENEAPTYGAFGIFGISDHTITNSHFTGNKANYTGTAEDKDGDHGDGGAIFLGSKARLTVTGSDFTANSASADGGAIATRTNLQDQSQSALKIANSSFKQNTAGDRGGAIYSNISSNVISDTSFNSNSARLGGAIFNDDKDKASNVAKLELINSTFTGNKATEHGGALYNKGLTTITDSSFTNNNAGFGGAIFNTAGAKLTLGNGITFTGNEATKAAGAIYNGGYIAKMDNIVFENNKALQGGAINNAKPSAASETGTIEAIENSKFIGNRAETSQGGAIRNQGIIKSIKNTLFEANAATNGGAINNGTWGAIDNIESIETVKFINNTATTGSLQQGGAIVNAGKIGSIKNVIFEGNKAGKIGGAIVNTKPQGNPNSSIAFIDTQFINNEAGTAGGAIHNALEGILSFSGNTVFAGNKAGGVLNDIYNDGKLSVDGTLTLDGGITGKGDITFAAGSTLNATLQTTTILANSLTTNGATLNLTLANGVADGSYDFVTANTIDQAFTLTENSLYNITMENNGQITLARKATDEISSGAGLSDSEAAAIIAASQSTVNNPVLEQMTAALQSGDTDTAKTLAGAINPTEAATQQVAANTNAIGAAVLNRLFASGPAMVARPAQNGRSGGDIKSKLAPWVQGLYTKTHNTQAVGFDAYSRGFAFGVDSDITNAVKVGIGYAYTATDIKSNRKTQVYGDNYFVYGQYKPHNWYVNGMFSYGHANYKEATVATTAKYNVDNYAAQIMTGYDYGIANNYAGVRYNYIDTETYNNGVADIKTKNAQIGTLVIGTKISKDFKPARGVLLTPEFRLAGTYDVKSDNNSATVAVMGASSTYSVTGERLSRGAIEAGVGLTANIKRLELSLGYDTSVRKRNFSQGGMVKAKYNF